jgi:peptidyl-prolyl cis-trans isomerase A (cyclophilin A)
MTRTRNSALGRALLLGAVGTSALLARPSSDAFAAGRRGVVIGAVAGSVGGAQVARAEDDMLATFTVDLVGESGGTQQVTVRLRPDWAPRGVKRFQELVKMGEMENSAVFHVDKEVADFGLPAKPMLVPDKIRDDIVRTSNRRGTLTFAQTAGMNGRVNQLFFNKADNGDMDKLGYSPIGEVVSGMDVVDALYGGYGDRPKISEVRSFGNSYLDKEFPKLSKIKKVEVTGATDV